MRTNWLTDWERAALAEAIRDALENGKMHAEHGKSLLEKLDASTHVRLSFTNEARAAA